MIGKIKKSSLFKESHDVFIEKIKMAMGFLRYEEIVTKNRILVV